VFSFIAEFHSLRRLRAALLRLYQIPEPGGNHTKRFTDISAFYAFRFMFRLLLAANDRDTEGMFRPGMFDDQGASR
jgi:hypothetical protein